eukprot:SAG11_NODE_2575_length_3206_cov_1.588993_5_plen_103_part_01
MPKHSNRRHALRCPLSSGGDGGFFPYNAFYNMFLSFAGEVAAEPNTWGGRIATIVQIILGLLGTALLLSLVFTAMVLGADARPCDTHDTTRNARNAHKAQGIT